MSIATVQAKLILTLAAVTDIPLENGAVGKPIPNEIRPGTFIEIQSEDFEWAYLGSAAVDDPTDSAATFIVLVVLHTTDLPVGQDFIDFLPILALRVRARMIVDTVNGDYANDGDKGFAASLTRVEYHQQPNNPLSAIKLTIMVKAYV